MNADDFITRLRKPKSKGPKKWLACCPAHDDNDPSLAVTEAPDGKILLRCFAGCSALDVVHAVGLEMTDLFPGEIDYAKPMAFAQREMAQRETLGKKVDNAKTKLAIITARLKRKEIVSERDIKQARMAKAFLDSQGVAL